MGQLSANPGAADLTPEMAAKLRQVEKEFERIEKSAGERSKWSWLGAIPRLMQIGCVLSIFGVLVSAVMQIITRMNATTLPRTEGWVVALQLASSLGGSLLLLLVATWANRYCEARSEGRISAKVL